MFQFCCRYLITVQVGRVGCCDLHGHVLAQFCVSALHVHENADLAAAMDVAVYLAFCAFKAFEAAYGNVFANLCNGFGYELFYSLAVHFGSKECVHICRCCHSDLLGNGFCQSLEAFIVAYEVRFAVDFHDDADFAVFRNIGYNGTFRRNASCFLCCLRQTFFTKDIYGLCHISVCFSESFLQSIIPAPVDVRSSFTMLAVIAAML